MYALDYHRLIVVELQYPSLRGTLAVGKVKPRHLYLLAPDERRKVAAEALYIQSIDVFEVNLAVFVPFYLIPVDVVIVQRQHDRMTALQTQLRGYPMGRGSLS